MAFAAYPSDFLVLCLAVAMLALAVGRDVYLHRIDNWITLPGGLLAVLAFAMQSGIAGAALSLAGLLVGLSAFLPFYLRGGMAAGDVKLMAAVGACLGPYPALWAALYTLVIGAFLGLLVLAFRGGVLNGAHHMRQQIWAFSQTRMWVPSAGGSALSQRFPYAMAIAGGYCLVLFVGVPIRA